MGYGRFVAGGKRRIRKMGALTVSFIRSLIPDGKTHRYSDGNTLLLSLSPTGAKSWVQRIMFSGKRHDIGLGGWPTISITEARATALENLRTARRGGDPLANRRARAEDPIVTFQVAAEEYHAANRAKWRTEEAASRFLSSLAQHVFPRIGRTPIDKIAGPDIIACLLPVWTRTPSVGRRLKQRMSQVFDYCQAHGHIGSNPCAGIEAALPARKATTVHHRALPYPSVPAALRAIAATDRVLPVVRACLVFLVLTAVRSAEARGARWQEVCLDTGEWRIPADRMKACREHRIPLSKAAVDVLRTVRPPAARPGALLFPSPQPGKQLSDMTLLRCLQQTGLAEATTVHGFRSSFRDWAAERSGHTRDVIETALAHLVGNEVERSYARSDLFDQRRTLMAKWAEYITVGNP